MDSTDSIYEQVGAARIINAGGTKTRLGGPRMRAAAADAIREAATECAHVSTLQAAASDQLQALTGAEAGHVTSGASAALTLATAACICGADYGRMAALPNSTDGPFEVIIPRTLRNTYDHAFRAAGATIVDVGHCDFSLGQETSNVEPWELADAITEHTVAIGYIPNPIADISLETVVDIAHDHDVPVIVDGAGNLPPTANLIRYVDTGADLVAFSGGKAIRGPQGTGLLIGRAELIESAARQHLDMAINRTVWQPESGRALPDRPPGVPRHGIGRGFKVSREEIVGLLVALEEFVEEDDAAVQAEWYERLESIETRIADHPAVEATISPDPPVDPAAAAYRGEVLPSLSVRLTDPSISETAVIRALQAADPPIYVNTRAIEERAFAISPIALTDAEATVVADTLLGILQDHAS